jgi:energy-coupling factor transporter ATP-binding protein EcfA2
MNMQIDSQNQEQLIAFDLIKSTNSSFFLTGRAGTGKTTFLKNVQQLVPKKFIVLAPTGVAAIQAGGETIHSFFHFPLHAMDINENGKITTERKEIILDCDTIVIDEVSMVRCDLIDAMDRMLRYCCKSHQPFGGKQIVFTGDMFQLEPILSNDADKGLILQNYRTDKPYFFKANVFDRLKLISIEFRKIYRQSDRLFVDILERVRNNETTSGDLAILNSRVGKPRTDQRIITLTSHNATAKSINEIEMSKINAVPFSYSAIINGEFDDKSAPTDRDLVLKIGAQVMFIRNDPAGRWVNGTLGELSNLTDESITVKIQGDKEYEITRVTWENMKYEYDKQSRKSNRQVVGTFTQYPLKTAWAITIHKSQGLTFDNVQIDLSRGVFANGQTYVALSRARSLEGLYLNAPVKSNHVMTSTEVLLFAEDFNNKDQIDFEIEYGKCIGNLLEQLEFDQAAKVLFDKGLIEFQNGNISNAFQLLNRSLDFVVCDDSFFGNAVCTPDLVSESPESDFIKAVYFLYNGNPKTGLSFIETFLRKSGETINGLYIKSRILTLIDRWQEADELHDCMARLIGKRIEPKLYFRGAIMNETKCDIPSPNMFQSLLYCVPNTLETHLLFREYYRMRNGLLLEKETSENILIQAFNKPVTDPTFDSLIVDYHQQKNESYQQYMEVVQAQVFE